MSKNNKKVNKFKEDSSTSLVGIIGILIILISFVGNNGGIKQNYLKANVTETTYAIFENSKQNELHLGEQTIKIDGKEYIVTVKNK